MDVNRVVCLLLAQLDTRTTGLPLLQRQVRTQHRLPFPSSCPRADAGQPWGEAQTARQSRRIARQSQGLQPLVRTFGHRLQRADNGVTAQRLFRREGTLAKRQVLQSKLLGDMPERCLHAWPRKRASDCSLCLKSLLLGVRAALLGN